MLDPDQIAHDEKTREWLSALAGLAAHYWDALHASGLPESAAVQMLTDWHVAYISDGVAWDDDTEG